MTIGVKPKNRCLLPTYKVVKLLDEQRLPVYKREFQTTVKN